MIGEIKVTEDKIAYFSAICMGLSIGGIRLSMAVSNILLAIATLCMLWYLHKTGYHSLRTLPKYTWMPIFVFAVCLIPALVISDNTEKAFRFYYSNFLFRPLECFVFVLMLRRRPEYVKKALVIACVLFCVEAIYSYYMHYAGIEPRAQGFNSDQPISPFTTCICIYMACSIIFSLDDAFEGKWKYFGIVMFVLSWVALIANDCRTGYITAIILMAILGGRYVLQSKRALIFVIVVSLGLSTFFCVNSHYNGRIASIVNTTSDISNMGRIALWKDSFKMWKDHPIFGVGLCSWSKIYTESYYETSDIRKVNPKQWAHPHSNYFLMLSEGGIVGLCGLLAMFSGLGLCMLNKFRKDNNPFWLMAVGIIIAYSVCGFFDSILLFSTPNRTFWSMLGMMTSLAEGTSHKL